MMSYFFSYTFMLLIFISFWCFVSQRSHLLVTLLSLEFIVLMMYMYMSYCLGGVEEVYFCLLFLSFCVCEGALGLSIMVSVVRTHGNDYFNSFIMLKC
uniref:NADH-ubiquinone oxidoreductase chain 4L n=1 Tax=Neoasterolepisma foreli TaxID=2779710 RepID=A0A7L9R578_9INSE|nr:NADH dehydrogenase subunit 4L [Neoasterolepisma foreli]QOL10510.1 NADH dehydrogenase subunit 4L [Neoasterolepisma foreli]